MTTLRFPVFLYLVAVTAVTAHGQYGLYGSPDLVQLPTENRLSAAPRAGYAVPAAQPAMAPQPQPGWQHTAATYPTRRHPMLQAVPAAPRYPVPPYAGPHYGMPVVAQPHPATANDYYTPATARLAEEPRQAIPVPPAPPGMAGPSPSPSDRYVAPPASAACGMREGDYLDYDPVWNQCGAMPQGFPAHGASYGGGLGYGASGSMFDTGCRKSRWYAGATTLFLNRNSPNRLWTSYEHGHFANQLMHTDFGLQWKAGGEVKFGYRFGCSGEGPWALQATYFTIDPLSGHQYVSHPNRVSTVLTLGNVFFHGWGANNWFDDALSHELWRRNEVHNVEVSFVRRDLAWTCGSRFDCDFEFGVRYFRFWEHLQFGTLAGPNHARPGVNRAYLEDKVSNNLLGFQFGVNMGYHIHPSCRIYAAPKFGVYNNHIDHYFVARLSDGTIGTVVDPPGESFPARSSTNALSFLTQIDVGLDWQVTRRLSAQVGYRVLVATGIALSDNQIPHFVNDIPEIRHIDRNGELVLHGAFAGVTFNY